MPATVGKICCALVIATICIALVFLGASNAVAAYVLPASLAVLGAVIYVLRRGFGRDAQALHVAAECGDHDLLKRLLAKRVDVNAVDGGSTALYKAAAAGRSEVVQTLLANGADVDRGVIADSTYPEDYELGESPLWVALLSAHLETARILVEHRADQHLVINNYGARPGEITRIVEDLDAIALASARRLRAEGKSDKALPLYEELVRDRGYIGRVPKNRLVVLREFAETYEMNGNHREALDFYVHALRVWNEDRCSSSERVCLFDGKPIEPEPFAQAVLDELVNHSDVDREEIGALLRGCKRALGKVGRVDEQARVNAALKQLESQSVARVSPPP